jgi:integrase
MQAWTPPELARFLRWAGSHDSDLAMCWRLLAATGMRRGEALPLRRRDVDLDVARIAVRRSVGTVKHRGAGEALLEGSTKTGRSRVVDLDAGTVAALRACRTAHASVSPDLVRDTAVVLSNSDGTPGIPRGSPDASPASSHGRQGVGGGPVAGDPAARPPAYPRHSVLADGVPVKVVSERLGHASATVTLTVYQRVHPGMGREAADRFAALLEG